MPSTWNPANVYTGEETFDISVEAALWLMISIRDRSLVGKHDIVSRGYICLDPRRYGDFLAHDLWLDLDPLGRILVRISMEGEQDDILFFFGRAFRSLKRTEGDMVRIFIDKVRAKTLPLRMHLNTHNSRCPFFSATYCQGWLSRN